MNFELNEDQRMIQDMAKRFAEKEIAPYVEEDEKNHYFRKEIHDKMADLGFFGFCVDEKYGGNGMGFVEACLVTEQMARVSGSWRLPINMQCIGPALTIQLFGTEEQKDQMIPKFVSGEWIGYFAITEPNTGSDVASMSTYAVDKGDHWEINGQKMFITNAPIADYGLLYAYTDKQAKHKGMTCFLVDFKNTPGIEINPIETKFGLHCSPTGEVVFNQAIVPKENVLGKLGDGFKICMTQLNNTRISCAAGALGLSAACLETAAQYANERVQFGKPIGGHQMVQATLAKMAAEHEAAKLLVYRAAWLKDKGLPNQYETSLAKYVASEAAVNGANECLTILGSYGYTTEYPGVRYLADARSFKVVEGTTFIQKLIIAKHILGSR